MPLIAQPKNPLTGKDMPVGGGDIALASPMIAVAPELQAALRDEMVSRYLKKFIPAKVLSPFQQLAQSGAFAGDRTTGSFAMPAENAWTALKQLIQRKGM